MNDEIIKQFLDNPIEGRLALSASLKNFISFFFWYMYRQQFIFRPFHLKIIRKLEDIAFGRAKKKNLIINLPPRHGKSSICQMYCAWSYMLNPHSNCIYTSYSDDLTSSFSKDIRSIIESEAFKQLTGIKLNKAKSGADYWATTLGGGFRAASMGGSITGFGCFSYNTKVVTDKGVLCIGDVVENKLPVKFKSWNGKTEWKKPIRYIKNNESEFIRIIMNDGMIIDCTSDHKFYTQEGIKRADELTRESIFPSNPFDNVSFYTKFKTYIFNRIVFVADKLSLFFCGNIFVNRSSVSPNPDSNSLSSPVNTSFNIANMRNRCSKIFSNFFVSSWVGGNLFSLFYRKFMVSVVSPMSNAVLFIVRPSSIRKVFRNIVSRIPVKMPNDKPFWSFSDKCFSNKRMDSSVFVANSNEQVTFFRFPRLKNASGLVEVTPNSSERGDFIDSLIFRNRKPAFIYKIGHFPSYCVTIPSNHNFFLAGSQEVLVGNCGISGDDFGGALIIDDPNKASSVKSQAELQNVVDYFNNTLKSRLNNQAKTPIILIMQRLGLEDLTGYLLENEPDDWDVIKLQGLNEETGEALWEEKYPAAELLKLKKVNPFVYYGQYQQEPIVIGGSVIKTEWFRYYPTSEHYNYQFTFITSDTAQKKGEANDFSVFGFWGKTFDNRLHLIDMVRGKWEADELRQQVKLCWEKWSKFEFQPYGFYIEDKSSGIGVIQEIKKTEPIPIIPIARSRYKNDQGQMVSADKFSRVMTAAPYLANGWVYLPNSEKDDISAPLLAECAAFRADLSHKHDDMCFVAGTKVATLFGDKNIEEIKKGEYVITPYGIRKVLDSKCTGHAKTIEKFGIEATPNHKFFTKNGFKRFDTLDDSSKLDILSLGGLIRWKYKKLLNLMEHYTDSWEGREGIISLNQKVMLEEGMLKDFMLRFGSSIRERKFLKALSFTTKTITLIITTSLIWSVYQGSNTLRCIKKTVTDGVTAKKLKNILKKSENLQKNGTSRKKEESGIAKKPKDILKKPDRLKNASNVVENFKLAEKQKSATGAMTQTIKEKKEQDLNPVYNLTISSDNVYYANRILVSNCDVMTDAIDIAFGASSISSLFI